MAQILAFLLSALTGAVGWFVARLGLRVAISSAAIAAWLLLITTFTLSMNACFDSVCSTALSTSSLPEMVLWGLSLIPTSAITMLACIASARAAAWSAIVAGRLMRTNASVAGVLVPK